MFFIRSFLLLSFFCVSSPSFAEPLASSNAVNLATEYLPLTPGNSWTYRWTQVGLPATEYTETVLSNPVNINGIDTLVVSGSGVPDAENKYYTNDSDGLHLYGASSVATPSETLFFTPPIQHVGPEVNIGQSYSSSGTAKITLDGLGSYTGTYSHSSTITGTEILTVTAGTYTTIKLESTLTSKFVVNGQALDIVVAETIWLAKNVGIVKTSLTESSGSEWTTELLEAAVTTVPQPAYSNVKTDFNGDGMADILWRNFSSGENYLYQMDGVTPISYSGINTVSDLNWKIVGIGDFDGDSKADILWRNSVTGQNYLYLMDGATPKTYSEINTVADLNWKIAGVGDFDGDSKADILWRNSSTGQNYLYLMDGATPKAYGGINTVGDLNWQIKGVDDFNGDGRADILWRHATTGQNYLYMMDGSAIVTSGLVSTIADANWKIAGVADFDGDSKADIFWRNSSTGQNYLYLMDGVTPKAYASINTVGDLNWQIKNIDDFNGDGNADVLWRHRITGHNYLYMMNGSAVIASGTINTVIDQSWEIK